MWNRIIKTSAALYIPLLIFTLVWGYLQKKELITNMGQIQQRNILSKSYNLIDQSMVLIDITSFWSSVTFPASFSDKKNIVILAGKTGSGKTNIINALNLEKVQTLNLEGDICVDIPTTAAILFQKNDLRKNKKKRPELRN